MTDKKRVLIPIPVNAPAEEYLTAHGYEVVSGTPTDAAWLKEHIGEYDAAVIRGTHITADILKAGLPRLKLIARHGIGCDNVDVAAATRLGIQVTFTPAASTNAVAEHTMGLLLTLNRRLHRAYIRTRDFNFSIVGLTGIDLYKKTVGIIGTGRIGRAFAEICRGFGMRVLAYDKYPAPDIDYVSLDTLLRESDVISLHCPLSEESYHMLDREAFDKMKKGVFLLNTSRGALIDSEALLDALNNGTLRGAGLDVYEEEAKFFFEDHSDTAVQDDTLALLISRPNVILTAHQAFLTEEALYNIAEVTVQNLDDFFAGKPLKNEVCIRCAGN